MKTNEDFDLIGLRVLNEDIIKDVDNFINNIVMKKCKEDNVILPDKIIEDVRHYLIIVNRIKLFDSARGYVKKI